MNSGQKQEQKYGGKKLWPKGVSGNLKGKPKGARHRFSNRLLKVLRDNEGLIAKKLIDAINRKDSYALRIAISKLVPDPQWQPIDFQFETNLDTLEDIAHERKRLLMAIAGQEMTPGQAESFMKLLDSYQDTLRFEKVEEELRTHEYFEEMILSDERLRKGWVKFSALLEKVRREKLAEEQEQSARKKAARKKRHTS